MAPFLAASENSSLIDSSLFLIVFGVYIAIMIGMSVVISKKQKTGEDFLLGNRSVPFFLILGTTIATLVGTGSSMGAVGKGYQTGWMGAFFGIGGAVGMILLGMLFSNVRKFNFMTMSEEVSFYYGGNKAIKHVIGFITYIASVGWLGAHIMGGAKYLFYVSEIDPQVCKLIVAGAFSIYVVVGGYMAVVWTDTIQAVILFAGFVLMGFLAVDKMGGFEELKTIAKAQAEIFFGKSILPSISLAVTVAVSTLSVPSFRQRIYSGDTVRNIKRSFIYTGIIYIFFSFFPAIIGMAAFKLNPKLEDPDLAFTYLAGGGVLPVAIGIIVLVAGLSATMSSASSDAIAGVSILMRDVYHSIFGKVPDKEKSVKFSRIGVAITIIIALTFTLMAKGVMTYILGMVDIIFSGMFACIILGKFWKRATWQGGLACLIGGSTIAISFMVQHKIATKESIRLVASEIIPMVQNKTLTKENIKTTIEKKQKLLTKGSAQTLIAEISSLETFSEKNVKEIIDKEVKTKTWSNFWGSAIIPAVSVALILGFLVSLLTPPNTVSDEEALKMLEEERRAMEDHEEVHALDEDEV